MADFLFYSKASNGTIYRVASRNSTEARIKFLLHFIKTADHNALCKLMEAIGMEPYGSEDRGGQGSQPDPRERRIG